MYNAILIEFSMQHYDKNAIDNKAKELLKAHKEDFFQEDIAMDVLDYIDKIYAGSNPEDEKVKLSALLIDTVARGRRSHDYLPTNPSNYTGSIEHAKREGMPSYFSFADYMLSIIGKSESSKERAIIAKSATLLSNRLWSNYSDSFSNDSAVTRAMYGLLFTTSQWALSVSMLVYSGVNAEMLGFSAALLGSGAVLPPMGWLLTTPFHQILPLYYHQFPPATIARTLFACSSAISIAALFTSGQPFTHKHVLALIPTILNLAQTAKEYIDYYKQADEIKGLIRDIEERGQQ